jgi:hypothetical protein
MVNDRHPAHEFVRDSRIIQQPPDIRESLIDGEQLEIHRTSVAAESSQNLGREIHGPDDSTNTSEKSPRANPSGLRTMPVLVHDAIDPSS